MKRVLRPSLQAIVALASCYTLATVRAQTAPLKLTETIALPGVEGRIDHFAFDAAGERLFVCALGNNTVEVVDLRKGVRVHSITGFGAPQGIAKGGICKIYDGKSFEAVGELDFKDDADNVRYDDATKKVYVGFGSGGIAVVNAPDGKQIGSIKLSAHPEAFELVGCRMPSKLVVLNTDSGDVVAKIDISGDPDDVFYDRKRHRIYAICGAGKIDIIEQTDANNYKALTKIDTAEGARTGLFVPERDTLFVAVPHRGAQQAEIRAYRVE